MAYDKIVICSGHLIDAPDRETPRFPASKAEAVRAEIARQLAQWNIGERDLAICGGASGGDILFAEESARCGARLRLLLAQTVDAFVRDSVERAGNEWVYRFHALVAEADVRTLAPSDGEGEDASIYARANLWILENARAEAGDNARLYALLVWDEKPTGDGPGGTSDFAARVRDLGGVIEIINPTKIP